MGNLVELGFDELGDSVVAGDVADGDVDLGVGEQLRNALVGSSDQKHIGSLRQQEQLLNMDLLLYSTVSHIMITFSVRCMLNGAFMYFVSTYVKY